MIPARRMALFAALLLALVLWLRPIVGRIDNSVEATPRVASTGSVEPLDAVAVAIFEETNAQRRRAGLPVLMVESRLAEIATAHSGDMLARGFFDHVSPDGVAPADRVATGHRTMVGTSGENLWTGSGLFVDDAEALARLIVDSWMGSQGHRENILRREFSHLGVGVAKAGDEIRATQVFGRVWGYLEEDLPARVALGHTLTVRVEPFAGRAATKIDFFSEGRPLLGPWPLERLVVDAPRGTYRTRFYFPTATGYTIAYGPDVEVVP
ncbi:MAG: CAP domain-containing protein [Acidobacteriota bacterium]